MAQPTIKVSALPATNSASSADAVPMVQGGQMRRVSPAVIAGMSDASIADAAGFPSRFPSAPAILTREMVAAGTVNIREWDVLANGVDDETVKMQAALDESVTSNLTLTGQGTVLVTNLIYPTPSGSGARDEWDHSFRLIAPHKALKIKKIAGGDSRYLIAPRCLVDNLTVSRKGGYFQGVIFDGSNLCDDIAWSRGILSYWHDCQFRYANKNGLRVSGRMFDDTTLFTGNRGQHRISACTFTDCLHRGFWVESVFEPTDDDVLETELELGGVGDSYIRDCYSFANGYGYDISGAAWWIIGNDSYPDANFAPPDPLNLGFFNRIINPNRGMIAFNRFQGWDGYAGTRLHATYTKRIVGLHLLTNGRGHRMDGNPFNRAGLAISGTSGSSGMVMLNGPTITGDRAEWQTVVANTRGMKIVLNNAFFQTFDDEEEWYPPEWAGGTGSAVNLTVAATSAVATTAGAGYAPGDVLTVVGAGTGTATQITVSTVGGSGDVATFTISAAGSYSALVYPAARTVTGGGGSGATFTLTYSIATATVGAAGTGHLGMPQIYIRARYYETSRLHYVFERGTGYAEDDTITIPLDGGSATLSVTSVLAGGELNGASVVVRGLCANRPGTTDYAGVNASHKRVLNQANGDFTTSGSGTGAVFSIVLSPTSMGGFGGDIRPSGLDGDLGLGGVTLVGGGAGYTVFPECYVVNQHSAEFFAGDGSRFRSSGRIVGPVCGPVKTSNDPTARESVTSFPWQTTEESPQTITINVAVGNTNQVVYLPQAPTPGFTQTFVRQSGATGTGIVQIRAADGTLLSSALTGSGTAVTVRCVFVGVTTRQPVWVVLTSGAAA